MRVPYSIQGAIFAPACAALIFLLRVTCPAPGAGCFAEPFVKVLFFPLPFFYEVFGTMRALMYHEPWFVLGYWAIVGLFVGLLFDIYKKTLPEQGAL